ncbi:MAG TPA: hypothetical protein VGJ16_01385 [Pirellulales bacterium]|jgi:ABC-type uncharacterized transport system permease subunit
MTSTIPEVVAKYRAKGLLIDSNLLLLLAVGAVERELVVRFKRTKQFLVEDYDLLAHIVSLFNRVVTTPHVLTEVSNLATSFDGQTRSAFFAQLGRLIEILDERSISSREVANDTFYSRLGITDTALTLIGCGQLLVLTVDASLASCISARNGDVINFNHLRVANW